MASYINRASRYLQLIKSQESIHDIRAELKEGTLDLLHQELHTDERKQAFWINIYNAAFIDMRRTGITKPAVYKKRLIPIADFRISLDEIEHGILRRFRSKASLGYLPQLFPRKIIKKLAVHQLDPRIHFALNCGAASCPPIHYYQLKKIDQQLSLAERSFIESDSLVRDKKKQIEVSKIFLWYQGDFGGKAGIKRLHSKVLKRNLHNYKLSYSNYDWTEDLDNWG